MDIPLPGHKTMTSPLKGNKFLTHSVGINNVKYLFWALFTIGYSSTMSDQSKTSWPKTVDGTTDWEVVFEDSAIGFIPLILKSQTPVMVEKTATIIIQKLFTRRSDVEFSQILISRLNTIVTSDDDLPRMHENVAVLMREIKNERIEKARVYIERQNSGAAIDRRSGIFWKINALLSPKIMIPLGLALVTALSGIVYFMLQTTLVPVEDHTAKYGQTKSIGETTKPKTTVTNANKTNEPATKPDPIPIWLKTVRWPFDPSAPSDHSVFYSVILYVADYDVKVQVCTALPTVMDGIYVAFNQSMPQIRPARVDEMVKTEFDVQKTLNGSLGHKVIEKVVIAKYGTKEFRAASLPPYCRSPRR